MYSLEKRVLVATYTAEDVLRPPQKYPVSQHKTWLEIVQVSFINIQWCQ